MPFVAQTPVDARLRVEHACKEPQDVGEPVEIAQHVFWYGFTAGYRAHDVTFRSTANRTRDLERRRRPMRAGYGPVAHDSRHGFQPLSITSRAIL